MKRLLPTRFHRATLFGALFLASGLWACSGKVLVGDAQDRATLTGETAAGASSMGRGSGESAVADACSEQFEQRRRPYLNWMATPNDFGDLAGSVFTGYIEGGDDLTLTIGGDQSAALLVGEAAPPPEADKGYLCDGYWPDECAALAYRLVPGATYPIHGATFEQNRLVLPFQVMSHFDPWCALQTPHDTGDCWYDIGPNTEGTWGETGCYVELNRVDCGWFSLFHYVHPCACTAFDCKAAITSPEHADTFDLRYVADEDKLEGSAVQSNGESQGVHLFRQVP